MAYDKKPRMSFGKHKGKYLDEVPIDYLVYIYDNGMVPHHHVRGWLKKNIERLKRELHEAR